MAVSRDAISQTNAEVPLALSVIVPVTEGPGPARELHLGYRAAIEDLELSYEIIYVLDGKFDAFEDQLMQLRQEGEELSIARLGKHFGEAATLEAGREISRGEWILTLPAYYQFEFDELAKLFANCDEWDMSVGRRNPRIDSGINQFLSRVFHGIVNWMTRCKFNDLSCGAKLTRRIVLDDIPLYGDQHRFVPILATQRGYRVREVSLSQSSNESFRRIPRIGTYPRRLLDLLTVFFLMKFAKKPLRFFGLIGASFASIGGIWTLVLVAQRLFFNQALGQRPALLLAALLVVLGVQIFALGLIGEIIIYAHARRIREYTIEKIIN
jgi:glycosyltransferase involved in cell wall biosynthesis